MASYFQILANQVGPVNGSLGTRIEDDPIQASSAFGPSTSVDDSTQPSKQDFEEIILEFSHQEEHASRKRCKKKNYKNRRTMALGNSKCMQFVKRLMKGRRS